MSLRVPRSRAGFVRLAVPGILLMTTAAGAAIVLPIPQAILPTNEPILAGAVYVGMGFVLLWFAHLGITLKSGVERLALRVDDPQTGLVAQLAQHITETRAGMGTLSNELEDVKQQMVGIEATCAATHQRQNGNGG